MSEEDMCQMAKKDEIQNIVSEDSSQEEDRKEKEKDKKEEEICRNQDK